MLVLNESRAASFDSSAGNPVTLPLEAASVYTTFEAMVEVNRPDEDGNWRAFAGSQKIAWKTGTSFGFRDGWAIGITPDYVVSVWIGNADGEGRPGLTGIKAAAPVLFSIFSHLSKSPQWFRIPYGGMQPVKICQESGYRAGEQCEHPTSVFMPLSCLRTTACPFHKLVHLTKSGEKRVESDCEEPHRMKHVKWFVLPPLIERYYKLSHPSYKTLPSYKKECARVSDNAMTLIYPKPGNKIYVPVELDGSTGRTVFEATHRSNATAVYWHLDEEYLGETREIHQLAINPAIGKHKLLLVDENGISQQVSFEVLGK
jgi:penicillin-binding protein 1C